MTNVYIAAPFFNEAEVETVKRIEGLLECMELKYFSPRTSGVLMDMDKKEAESKYDFIFRINIERLNWCDTVVAVIDNRDIGTIWEMGFAFANEKDIISYTAHDYGLNIMLAKSVRYHAKSTVELHKALSDISLTTSDYKNLY